MKSIYIYLGAIICLLCACSTDEHLPDVSKFYYPIPDTPLKEAVNLGAYYYTYKLMTGTKDIRKNLNLENTIYFPIHN